MVKKYGADSFRLYEMFMGPLDKSKPWSTKGLQGCCRFLQKVWRLFHDENKVIEENCADQKTIRLLHQTNKKVTEDLDELRFNTAVSQLMIFTNHMINLDKLDSHVLHHFLKLLNPFAPHVTEELNKLLGLDPIVLDEWPSYDSNLIVQEKVTIAVQFNGKTRGTIEVGPDTSEKVVIELVKSDPKLSKYFDGMTTIKSINIPNKLINFVLKTN